MCSNRRARRLTTSRHLIDRRIIMEPMTDELKETIIREHPDGIWLVLAEENPPNIVTGHDLLCGKYRAKVFRFHCPAQLNRCVGERYA